MEYYVQFDDGTFLGFGKVVREYPDAQIFTSARKAMEAARKVNKDYTVVPVENNA